MLLSQLFVLFSISSSSINRGKTSTIFSQNTQRARRAMARARLGLRQVTGGMELAVPLSSCCPFVDDLAHVIDAMRGRISSWGARSLSLAGRVTLINSMLTSIPMDVMTHAWVLIVVLMSIERMIHGFH